MGTGCPTSVSFHKRHSVLFLQSHFLCPWNSLLWKANSLQSFLLVFLGFLLLFFFSGSGNCSFPPLQTSHISPCFSFCIRIDWFQWKTVNYGQSSRVPSLHLGAAWPMGRDEGSDRTELLHRLPSLETHCCASSLNPSPLSPVYVVGQRILFLYKPTSKCLSVLCSFWSPFSC